MINIKSEAAVVIFLTLSTRTSNNMGLKNMPPPIPTIPDINPIEPPIKIETILGPKYSIKRLKVRYHFAQPLYKQVV